MAKGNLRFGMPPESVAGGIRTSGFCASTAGFRGPAISAPRPPEIGWIRSVMGALRLTLILESVGARRTEVNNNF